MRRKRLEAWAKSNRDGELWGHCRNREVLEANYNNLHEDEYPTVHLVECGPDEVVVPKAAAAVVRAAVRAHKARPGTLGRALFVGRLFEAVERMKGRKR